jgi:hypothetical protein
MSVCWWMKMLQSVADNCWAFTRLFHFWFLQKCANICTFNHTSNGRLRRSNPAVTSVLSVPVTAAISLDWWIVSKYSQCFVKPSFGIKGYAEISQKSNQGQRVQHFPKFFQGHCPNPCLAPSVVC